MPDLPPVLDTHVLLRRGGEVLLSQRGSAYGYGRWHLPSGKLEPGEALPEGAARELAEETGVVVDPDDLTLAHVVHHHQGGGAADRIGFFFQATRWSGEPVNREPDKCLALRWFPADALPEELIPYPAVGLTAVLKASPGLTTHGW
ncbi:NUDIX hydrolase [Allostreptomyces psammosilenae]|uniref:8-oxo-dGTP pyrophosphatase MutT (NUDIX family) n=1 Tax=Allostreptomyces psammosilenae TaxID=1892865 RepID=A0A853A0X7_9ACTN|nr:NUDIX domain-containing protein [Allostreptomyces psammosilenae]NYI07797.1 8-oxo-dGTP pyrophosphatase MutT (NUDIX family) [Allostreptomyces psammosilenae]